MAVATLSHGTLNSPSCEKGTINTPNCQQYIRAYTLDQLVSRNQEVYKSGNNESLENVSPKKEARDKIVFACHKAVSINNLVKKIQGKLLRNNSLANEVDTNIDSILNQYLFCRKGFFGQPTNRF